MYETPETSGVTTDDLDQILPTIGIVVHDVEQKEKSLSEGLRDIRELVLKLVRSKRRRPGSRR